MNVLKFSATWCGPCQGYAPVFDAVVKEFDVEVERYDVDDDFDVAMMYGVTTVPTTILTDGVGVELRRHAGVLSVGELRDFLAGE